MKTYLIVLCVVLFAATTFAQNPEPLSFRNRALGGIINDNLDLVFDPVELHFVDTLHLFTNLSNLSSTSEKVFNNRSDNEFLIGASRKNLWVENLWSALLIRFQKSKSPNSIWIDNDLNGSIDEVGLGSLQNEYTGYLDTDFNGLYDLKRTVSQNKAYTVENDGWSFVVNNSYQLDDITLGLKFAFGNGTVENNSARSFLGTGFGVLSGANNFDPTFSRSVNEFYLDSNYSRLIWSENGDFLTKDELPFFRINVGGLYPSGDFEFRGDLGFRTFKDAFTTGDSYKGMYEYFSPRITNYARRYSESDGFTEEQTSDGSAFGVGGSARYTFDKQAQRRNDGYVAIGVAAEFTSFDFVNARTRNFTSAETQNVTSQLNFDQSVTRAGSSKDNGDGSGTVFQFGARLNVPFLDGVHFGLGAFYTISNSERNTKFSQDTSIVAVFDDKIQNANDITRTETGSVNADRTYEVLSNILRVPVGIEYWFTENRHWAIRFGSVFQYNSSTVDDAKKIISSKPYTINERRGSGAATITTRDNVYSSRSEQRNTASSSTFFTYGLGYVPTNNLQIDVLGFFDVNNNVTLLELLKSLRLSFVVKL